MDGMNQNDNNPYGQSDNSYQVSNPYSQNDVQQPDNVYRQGSAQQQMGNPYQQNSGAQMNNPYQQNNDPYNHNPYQPQDNFGAPSILSVQPYDPQGKKKGAGVKIAIGIGCALVVLVGIGIGALAYYRSTPEYKIRRGLLNLAQEIEQIENPLSEKIGIDDIMMMLQEDGGHVETELDFTVNVPYVGETTLGVDTDFYKDVEAKELSADTALSVMNYDFAHLNIYANDEVFCFSMPELFMENMYIENENVVSQYNDSVLAMGSPANMEDFSIELFPDEDERVSFRNFRNTTGLLDDFESDLNACRENMTMEKVDKGLYRVTFPAKETDRLMKSILESYSKLYGAEEELDAWKEYKKLVLSDVCLLFEINGDNHIESIMLEEPLVVLDGGASFESELFFMGEKRSIDMLQGKIKADGVDGKEREVLWQLQQTIGDETYRMDMDLRAEEEAETIFKMKLTADFDARKDDFEMTYSLKDEEDDVEFALSGSIDDFDEGESVEIDLDEAALRLNGEDVLIISGEVYIEPLQSTIEPSVEPKTAFFEMSWSEWIDIIANIEDEYGGLLDSFLW